MVSIVVEDGKEKLKGCLGFEILIRLFWVFYEFLIGSCGSLGKVILGRGRGYYL